MKQNRFFTKINYSASNEDSESERKALDLKNSDTVLCITGSGARSLDLLVDLPQKIISIDLNPSQNFLLELKIAAFRVLDYQEFGEFIGLHTSANRHLIYKKLQPLLSPEAGNYWQKRPKAIGNGILYCGTWEKLLRGMLKLARPRKKIIAELMNAPNMAAQQNIWSKKWDNVVWRFYLKVISNQFLWKHVVREPGARIIPDSFDVYAYIKQCMEHMAMNFDLKTNHYAHLIFCGGYQPRCILPHYLRPENFELIKNNLDRVEIVTASLSDYLKPVENEITAFSLSDFSSYAPTNAYGSIWQSIIRSATPGARFCERQFLVKRNPEAQHAEIERDELLETALRKTDEAYIYTFCVGKIRK